MLHLKNAYLTEKLHIFHQKNILSTNLTLENTGVYINIKKIINMISRGKPQKKCTYTQFMHRKCG